MNWVSIIAMVFSGIGLIISVMALIQSKKSNKAAMRQNLEQELASINAEIKNIEAQQAEAEARGKAETRNITSACVPNPYEDVIQRLELKKQNLLGRKGEISRQLKQL